jgi:hypothetical protein
MNGASRWLEANAVLEKPNRKAAAMTLRMTLLQTVVDRVARYFARPPGLVLFAIIFSLSACKPNAEEQRKRDLAALPQGGSLPGQLQAEAAARLGDADTITFEKLKAALEKDGVMLGPTRQVVARNQLAIFCAAADSNDGLIVTVCEYPSPEQAKRGEIEANLVADKIAGHSSKVRKKSVLHLVHRSDTPDAQVAKVFAAFERL